MKERISDGVGKTKHAMGEGFERARPYLPSRRRTERAGLVAVGALSVVVLVFLVLDSLRGYPPFGFLRGQFLVVGEWMDFYLGTRVFQYGFMWRSIATGVLIGVVAPLVGAFVVHKEMALIGETLAHTAFAGVAVGLLATGFVAAIPTTGGTLLLAALVVSVAGAVGLQWLTERSSTYGDVPIAIVLSGSFAVGTILISYGRERMAVAIDTEDFLFGSAAVVTAEGAYMMAVLAVGVVAVVVHSYKPLLFVTFDEQAARVAGFNVRGYNTLLIVMTAVVVVGAMQILGVILVAAMLVVPVAAASQVSVSFRETVYLSVLFGQVSVLGGYGVAVAWSLPPGGSIVVAAILIYLAAILVSNRSFAALSAHGN